LVAAAEAHGSDIECLFGRLLDHVHDRGVKLGWGKGASPGVSGWYQVSASATAVWTANVGSTPGSRPSLYFYFPTLRERLSTERFDAFVTTLSDIPSFRPKLVAAAARGWKGYPFLDLTEIARSSELTHHLFMAIDVIADRQTSLSTELESR
jgi:hypothetical protein